MTAERISPVSWIFLDQSPTPINNSWGWYFVTQWAAVITCLSVTKVPPQ